jgi:pimeloyl-ACP methyl ester carboxylesterase
MMVLAALLASASVLALQPQTPNPASTEQLVYARAEDGIVSGGGLFRPRDGLSATRVAAIWIHGSGVNFYYPSYVKIARELAKRGLPTIVGNTRMHDLGNIEAFREPTNARGGSYWGITTDQVGDVAAWIQLARDCGYDRVVLVGHSAGATAVQIYMARTQDPHVEGLVLASGRFQPAPGPPVDSTRLARAKELVAAGRGGEPVPPTAVGVPPSPTSAATLVDLAGMGVELSDFYGVTTPNPPVARVHVPILAWFGTNDDVGTSADLELLEKTLKNLAAGPSRVSTAIIPGASHMYDGHETAIAETLANWVREIARSPEKARGRR